MMRRSRPWRHSSEANNGCWVLVFIGLVVFGSLSGRISLAQSTSPQQRGGITVEGTVRDSAGEPISGASVLLEERGQSGSVAAKTGADGAFVLSAPRAGTYVVKAEKSGLRNAVTDAMLLLAGETKHVHFVLESMEAARPPSSGSSSAAMEFDDKPNFTVAGVTDWTAAGGHGSDTNLRTSEALAKETLALKFGESEETSGAHAAETGPTRMESEVKLRAALAGAPGSFEANHQLGVFYFRSARYREAIPLLEAAERIHPGNPANTYDLALAYKASGDFVRAREQARKMLANADTAEGHSLLGDLDEQLGDPLGAVREYEQAVRMNPSERNYFAWATELLLHRAVEQSAVVFAKASSAYPNSATILAGLGAALYAGGSYREAARRLCEASDLNPADPAPYLFLGKMDKATPAELPCAEQKLARFARQQPGNAQANYYYAMTLWKRERGLQDSANLQKAAALLEKAVSIDPQFGEAYLQLGILYFARGASEQAVHAYKQAITVTPRLGEAHYRLGLVYKRMGEAGKAEQEFQAHEQIEKTEAAAVESQRREIQQFLIILKDPPAVSPPREK